MWFKIKHIPNLLVRVLTKDKYYVCEECHKIHKRDGREIRLDEPKEHLMSHPLWYGSVCCESFIEQQVRVSRLLKNSLLGKEDKESFYGITHQ